jgi:hypothetical protein
MAFQTPPLDEELKAELLPLLRKGFATYDAGKPAREAFHEVVRIGICRIAAGDIVAVREAVCDGLPQLRDSGASEELMLNTIISAGFETRQTFHEILRRRDPYGSS